MLSIKQLEVAIDSLQTGLKSRKEMDADRMLSTNYVKQRVRNAKRDSVLREETEGKIQDLDSLYTSFDAKEQKRMLEEAVGFARAAKQFHWNDLSYLSSREETIRRHQIEWHRKFTLSFACFIFFFIGAPLGGIIRKGGLGMPVVVSIFLFIVYYIIWMMGERAAREGVLEPWQGMWISSVVLLPLGAFLTYTAMTDSAVMSTEAYANFVKKIVGFFKKKKNA